MTRFIIVRHGESIGNLDGRFYGHTNGGLTDRGRLQAERAAVYLADTRIDAAYASDLIRAYETGRIVAAPHGLTPTPDKNLREICAGEWENQPFDELPVRYPEAYGVWMTDIGNSRPTGGESVREMAERVRTELWRIASAHEGETVLIATHSTPIRALECGWRGLPIEEMQNIRWVMNCSVSVADYDTAAHTVSLVTMGEAGFLEGIATALPTNV